MHSESRASIIGKASTATNLTAQCHVCSLLESDQVLTSASPESSVAMDPKRSRKAVVQKLMHLGCSQGTKLEPGQPS